MAERYDRIELQDTRQFTIVYSVAPPIAPLFSLRCGSAFSTLIASLQGTASSTTAYFCFHQFSTQVLGLYAWTWTASYASVGPVVERGVIDLIATNTW